MFVRFVLLLIEKESRVFRENEAVLIESSIVPEFPILLNTDLNKVIKSVNRTD